MTSGLWITPSELGGTLSSDAMAEEACRLSSFILWALTGRKYGAVRTVTETYECACSKPSDRYMPYRLDGQVMPALLDGQMINATASSCGCDGVSGGRHTRLRLHGTPVRHVNFVRRDDETLDPGSYTVHNSGLLSLAGRSSDDVCGLTVSYSYGTGIPGGGRLAAKLLSEEFLKSWSGDEECRLPDRVTNVSRQGISFSVIDRQEFLDDLRTGILEVDMFLRAVNPERARKKTKVFSPDLPKSYRTTANFSPANAPRVSIARPYDMQVTRGHAVDRGFRLYGQDGAPRDLTGKVWKGEIRESYAADSPVILDLSAALTLSGTDPTLLILDLSGAETDSLPTGRLFWHVYLDDSKWLYGQVLVTDEDAVEGA